MLEALPSILAVLGLWQPEPARAGVTPGCAMWLNSHHLAGLLAEDVTGLEGCFRQLPPLSDRGARVLDALVARGLTPAEFFDDPSLVASTVLAGLPRVTCVVPTEQYFYFEILFRGEWIAGNLRTTGAEQGQLHCGYYYRDRPHESRYALLGSSDGLCIDAQPLHGRCEVHVHDEKTGADVTFIVPDAATLPFASAVALLPSEQIVSPIIDESGTALLLLFDRQSCKFCYVLAAAPPDDAIIPFDHPGVWKGERSKFLYVADDVGRSVLAGVSRDEVSMNTFYDGPFDQVPPTLPLRPLIRWAYPGIEARREDSLDEHGNWVIQASSRVAIAPYTEYSEGEEERAIIVAHWLMPRAATPEPLAPRPPLDAGALLQEYADILRNHATDWPQGHDLMRSSQQTDR